MPSAPFPRTAGAETAITTLWPWKVKQLAAEDAKAAEGSEGVAQPFAALEKDITKVLTTVLVGVTFCTIFGTALGLTPDDRHHHAVPFFTSSGVHFNPLAALWAGAAMIVEPVFDAARRWHPRRAGRRRWRWRGR